MNHVAAVNADLAKRGLVILQRPALVLQALEAKGKSIFRLDRDLQVGERGPRVDVDRDVPYRV